MKNESNQFNNQKLPFIIDVNNIVHDNSTLTTSIPTIPDLIIQSNNDNLIVSPHMAGLSYESEEKAFLISANNILKYFIK